MKQLIAAVLLSACATTSHPVTPATLGEPQSRTAMEGSLATPGPLAVETIVTADWEVPLSGLLNLDKAMLADRGEPIKIFVHVIRHPTRGTFIVDTGVERGLRDVPKILHGILKADKLIVHQDAAAMAQRIGHIDGIFLTHIHLDHALGLPDLDKTIPVYAGPGDAADSSFEHMFTRSLFNTFFEGFAPIREWAFGGEGVIDVFGDGSLWAIHVPGHTPGSTAFLARTATGPVLMVGDACHTRYGWEHDIEPGTFSWNRPLSTKSLQMLRALVQRHPEIAVRLGHQE